MGQPPEKQEQAPALQKESTTSLLAAAPVALPIKLRNWPHSPCHMLRDAGAYIVTSGTYRKLPLFKGAERLTILTNYILELSEKYGWLLQAWAVFPNHYHLAGESQSPESLRSFMRHLHSITAIETNKWDATPGRRVWFEYWETRISFPRSYFARLNYVHQNAVRHGLVRHPSQYPWCSAGWFENGANPSFFNMVSGFKTDKVNVPDDFEVAGIE